MVGIFFLQAVQQFLSPAGGSYEVAGCCVVAGEFAADAGGGANDEDLLHRVIYENFGFRDGLTSI